MSEDWKKLVASYFRKRCTVEIDAAPAGSTETVTFYAFDPSREGDGVETLVDDYIDSEFYNPKTGQVYRCTDGVFYLLPSPRRPLTLDKLGIRLADSDAEAEDDEDDAE
jgi:hypothetical protein